MTGALAEAPVHRHLIIRRPLVAFALLLWCSALSALARAQEGGQEERDGALVDADYRFQIVRPDRAWEILPEGEARKIVPDAVAGILKQPQVYGVIIAEIAGEGSVEDWARTIVDSLPLEDRREEAFELSEIQGRPAVRAQTRGRINGLAIRYQHLVFLNQGYLFQIVTWGLQVHVKADGRAFQPAVAAFRLLDGPVRGRSDHRSVTEAHGVGWRVHRGVFTHAPYGLRIAPPPAWRVVVGDELAQMNGDAAIGLVNANETAYFIVIAELASGVDPVPFEQALRDSIAESNEARPDPVTARIAGAELRLDRYSLATIRGMTLLHGARIRDGIAYQLQAWFHDRLAEEALGSLGAVFEALEFLDGEARERAHAELADLPDTTNSVGPRHSFRQGIYRDFEHAFSWRRPRGYWLVATGDAARAENADCCLFLEELGSGIFSQVIAEEPAELDSSAFHEAVLDNLEASGELEHLGTTQPSELGGVEALTTSLRIDLGGHGFAFEVTTATTKHRAYQFLVWGLPGNMSRARELVTETLRAFELHPRGLQPVIEGDGQYQDLRLGFELLTPTEGATFEEILPAQVRALGTGIRCRYEGGFTIAVAVTAIQDTQDAAWFEQFAMTGVVEKLRLGLRGAPEQSEDTLGGLPCRRRSWRTKKEEIAIFSFLRDRTHFAYFVSAATAEELEAAKARFRLLP